MAAHNFGIIEGPSRCIETELLCARDGGSSLEVRKPEIIEHSLPKSKQEKLITFLEARSCVSVPKVSVYHLPKGRIYDGVTILSGDCSAIARDVSVEFNQPFENHRLLGRPIVAALPLYGTTMAVSCLGAQSYYHWLLDELPRLLIPGLEDIDRLMISPPSSKRLHAIELIRSHLGFKWGSLFWPNAILRHVYCENLVCPSYISPTGHPSSYVVTLLKDIAAKLTKDKDYTNLPEKIIIIRRAPAGRNLSLTNHASAALVSEGFVPVALEDLDWLEQIVLFKNVREIVAPHGAGLANLVFCEKKPIVIELFNSSYAHWCFWQLANLVGAQYIPISFPFDSEVKHDPSRMSLGVDISDDFDLTKYCKEMIAR